MIDLRNLPGWVEWMPMSMAVLRIPEKQQVGVYLVYDEPLDPEDPESNRRAFFLPESALEQSLAERGDPRADRGTQEGGGR